MQVIPMPSYRVRFAKQCNLRYLSHLELVRAIGRGIRRAGLQMVYSEGFHPHPKLSFGPALSVGIASNDEYFDMELAQECPENKILEDLNRTLSEGLKVLAVREILHQIKPLNAQLNRASYAVMLKVNPGEGRYIFDQLNQLLSLTIIEVLRKSKKRQKRVNIRPWLHNLTIEIKDDDLLELEFVGEIGNGGNLRPDDLLSVVARPFEVLTITRTGLWHEEDGLVTRPLDFCDKAGG